MALGVGTAIARQRAPGPALLASRSPWARPRWWRSAGWSRSAPPCRWRRWPSLRGSRRGWATPAARLLTALPVLGAGAVGGAPAAGARTWWRWASLGWCTSARWPWRVATGCRRSDWSCRSCRRGSWSQRRWPTRAAAWANALRLTLALGLSLLVWRDVGLASRHVVRQRSARWWTSGRDALAGARRIATLGEVVGVATGAHVVDVAGVTPIRPSPGCPAGARRSAWTTLSWSGARSTRCVALWDARRGGLDSPQRRPPGGAGPERRVVSGPELPLAGSTCGYRVFEGRARVGTDPSEPRRRRRRARCRSPVGARLRRPPSARPTYSGRVSRCDGVLAVATSRMASLSGISSRPACR